MPKELPKIKRKLETPTQPQNPRISVCPALKVFWDQSLSEGPSKELRDFIHSQTVGRT